MFIKICFVYHANLVLIAANAQRILHDLSRTGVASKVGGASCIPLCLARTKPTQLARFVVVENRLTRKRVLQALLVLLFILTRSSPGFLETVVDYQLITDRQTCGQVTHQLIRCRHKG